MTTLASKPRSERKRLPTYVTLLKFTDQGIRNVKGTVQRTEANKQAAAQAGVIVKDVFWVQGQYDIVAVSEAPDEATAMALNIGKAGNATTQTMRAFSAAEMEAILAKVA